jgi:type II secretory pathway pseudopilin PulG
VKALTTPIAIVIAAALLALSGYMSARELASVEQRRYDMWVIAEDGAAYRLDTYTGAMHLCTPQGCERALRGTQSADERLAELQRKYGEEGSRQR